MRIVKVLLVVAALMVFFGCASTQQMSEIESRLDGIESRLDGIDSRISGIEERQDTLEAKQSEPMEVGRSMQMDEMDEALMKAEAAAKRAEAAAEKAEKVYQMRLKK